MKRFLAFLALAVIPAAALAADDVTLTSEVLVEKTVTDAGGKQKKVLEMPKVVTPGEPLLFKLKYVNTSAAPVENFVITNPIPDAVRFAGTESGDAVYSVDGGKIYAPIAVLSVKGADGAQRPAQTGDVTHVQFTLKQPIAPGGKGEVSFRGVVK